MKNVRFFSTPLSVLDPPGYASLEQTYEKMAKNIEGTRAKLGKPLSLAEKIIYGHLDNLDQDLVR